MSIFDHTDDDGDRIMITKAESGHWVVGIVGHQGDIAQMILDDEAIERLHKASGPEIAPETVREYYGLRPYPKIMSEPPPMEISWPEDGRRVAALNAAGEVLQSGSRTARDLIRVADWIIAANREGDES